MPRKALRARGLRSLRKRDVVWSRSLDLSGRESSRWRGRARQHANYASETHTLLHFDFDWQQMIDHVSAAIGIAMRWLRSAE